MKFGLSSLAVILIWINQFFSQEINSVLLLFLIVFLIFNYMKIKLKSEFNLLFLFTFFLFIEGFLYSNNYEDLIRDSIYWFSPILILYIGYNINDNKNSINLPKILVYLSFIDSLIFLTNFFVTSNIQTESFHEFRQQIGKISFLSTFIGAVIVGLPKNQLSILLNTLKLKLVSNIGIIIFVCVIISQARFQFLSFIIIALLCRTGKINFKFIKRFTLTFISIIGIFFAVFSHTEIGNKLYNSTNELNIFSAQDIQSKSEANEVWRAYEAFQGIQHYLSYDYLGRVFGTGLGSTAPLNESIKLKGYESTTLFLWHLAFITIIVKGGLVGLLIYISFFMKTLFQSLFKQKLNILVGVSTLYLFLGFFTSQGWFAPKFYPIILFLGYLFKRRYNEAQIS